MNGLNLKSMYSPNQIKHIHLEPTQRCQAACPMCDRTNNRHIKNAEITLDQFMNMVDIDFIQQLNSLLMCGNHGDPIISSHTLDILRYLRVNNPDMYLHVTTNAGARDADWWRELVMILGKRGKVTFSVDGLEDTNHLYRINVNWKKVEESMDAFTQAGGKGIWVYLIFEHNENQVEEAEQMAKLFGLEFVRKKTGRWVQSYKGKKIDKKITSKANEIKPDTKNPIGVLSHFSIQTTVPTMIYINLVVAGIQNNFRFRFISEHICGTRHPKYGSFGYLYFASPHQASF